MYQVRSTDINLDLFKDYAYIRLRYYKTKKDIVDFARAILELTGGNSWNFDGENLTIKSSSGDTYLVDGRDGCQCEAFRDDGDCWHFAAGSLLYFYTWHLYEGEDMAVFDEFLLQNSDGDYISEGELDWVRGVLREAEGEPVAGLSVSSSDASAHESFRTARPG